MTSLPPELLLFIFQAACDDDGTTARSLASVSRLFYVWALPFVYHVLAVHDLARLELLVRHFQHEPRHVLLVQHILIADRTSGLDCLAMEQTLKTLWSLISPALKSLTLVIHSRHENVGKVFQTVFDTSFPRLANVTLSGNHPIPPLSLPWPDLKRFHSAGITKKNVAGCFTPLTQSCPGLSHVRISMASENNITLAVSAAFSLPGAPTDTERMCLDPIPLPGTNDGEITGENTYIPFPTLPRGLVSLAVKPAAPPMPLFVGATSMFYIQYMKQLENLAAACPQDKFALLPAFKRTMWEVESYDVTEAKRDWVEVMRGGMGAWGAHEQLG